LWGGEVRVDLKGAARENARFVSRAEGVVAGAIFKSHAGRRLSSFLFTFAKKWGPRGLSVKCATKKHILSVGPKGHHFGKQDQI
jgi:hypothetical protein